MCVTGTGKRTRPESQAGFPLGCVHVYVCVWGGVLSHVQLFATPWTITHQAPLSMGFSRQEYWIWLPFPPPGDLPDSRIEPASPGSPVLAGKFFYH